MILSLTLVLATIHATRAYISAPLANVCTRDEDLSSQSDLHLFHQRALTLEGSGHRSAAKLSAKMSDPPCTLIIEVPKDTHVIAVSLHNFPEGITCPLTLWFLEGSNQEDAWRLSLCDREKRRLFAIYPEVYPHRVTLRWYPVFNFKETGNNSSRLNKVLSAEEQVEIMATAVGRGSVCEDETKVLCWKSKKESLCVSEELSCDGYLNCPRPGNDESPSMCPQTQGSDQELLKNTPSKAWDFVSDHIRRIMAVRAGDKEAASAASSAVNWSVRKNGGGGSKGGKKASDGAALDASDEGKLEGEEKEGLSLGAFSRLGIWTFVLLVMLACGLLLLLCGLWECCCRTREPPNSLSPRGSLAMAGGQQTTTTTTTVLIISSSTSPPPQYEDLEQPPDYKELFPGRSRSTAV